MLQHQLLEHTFAVQFKNNKTYCMKKLFFIALMAAGTQLVNAADWTADLSHSKVRFSISHMAVSETDGSFKVYDAKVSSEAADFSDAKIEFTIDVNSINTDNDMRDGHLKGEDFFNAAKYPKMTFKSVSFKKVSGNKYILEGDLTIKDVTKRVKFDVVYGGTVKDPYGNTKAGFKVTGIVDRYAFGLKYNALTEAGGAMIGQEVNFVVNLELQKQK
jgi:polyisoprenoid-binding protein YceI